jgi:Bacteriocin-protection, YdeI or OmpD-Associated/Domain of unknown function (DUF1905)
VPRFAARVSKNTSGGHTVVVPFDPKAAFGKVRAPVRATVNGHTFRTRLARYGGVDYLGFNREAREAAGISDGDLVTIELELDEEQRTIDIPHELAVALADDDGARAAFDALSPSHRREYASWIAEAKRADTRARRVGRTLEQLREHAGSG